MKISTILIVIGMMILTLYASIEVSYYASQIEIEHAEDPIPIVTIPSLNISEKINNKSISYGVYHEPESYKPNKGTVVIFGHRTLYGSPFLKINELKKGDTVYLTWPGIGKAEYKVTKSFVVPASYYISVKQGKRLFLITCHPIGSTQQRLIVETKLQNIDKFEKVTKEDNPNSYYGIIIILSFLIVGLLITKFYGIADDKIILFSMTLVICFFLGMIYLLPLPPDAIAERLSDINSIFGT